MPEVVNRVKNLARQSGISLLEISRSADVSYSMLRRIADGRGNLCLEDAAAVADALGRHVDELFVLEDAEASVPVAALYSGAGLAGGNVGVMPMPAMRKTDTI